MKSIQTRFETLNCLDLDFSMFRGLYYTVKNNNEQYFKEYLKKNEPNKKLITQYQDDFYLFQKKKNHKELKKSMYLTIQKS